MKNTERYIPGYEFNVNTKGQTSWSKFDLNKFPASFFFFFVVVRVSQRHEKKWMIKIKKKNIKNYSQGEREKNKRNRTSIEVHIFLW